MAPAPALPDEFLDSTCGFMELLAITRLPVVTVMQFAPVLCFFAKQQHAQKNNQRHRHNGAKHDQNVH
jgi:hypothetical protein